MSIIGHAELTPFRIAMAIRKGWWILVVFVVAGVASGEIYLSHATPYFTSGFTIVPKENSMDQGVGAQARLLLGAGSSADRTRFEVLQLLMESDRLTKELVDRGALPLVFANRWDASSRQWSPPSGVVSKIAGLLRVTAGLAAWEAPDARLLRRYIDGHTKKVLLKASGAVEIYITHDDPAVAFWLAQNILSASDSLYRADENKIEDGRIAHLKGLLETETNATYRQNLIGLLQTETQSKMMLSSGETVASKVVESPVLPTKPSGPGFLSTLMLTTALGMFLGALLAVAVYCGFFRLSSRRPVRLAE